MNTAGRQRFSHLRTLIEMCGITSMLHIQINGLKEGNQFHGQQGHQMTSLDYFLWGSVKCMVYGNPVTSEEDLIARIHGRLKVLQDNCTYWVMCVKLNTADVGSAMRYTV